MADIREITDLSAPELDVFARLTEAQLRSRREPEKGVFIAESPKVIIRALDAGFAPVSFLMEQRHITGDAAELLAQPDIDGGLIGGASLKPVDFSKIVAATAQGACE